jgi:hypothetical protein
MKNRTNSQTGFELPNSARTVEPAIADPTSALAYARLGILHAVMPGDAAFTDEGVEAAWIDGQPVAGDDFCAKAERAVREHVHQFPSGALARDVARLDASRAAAARAAALLSLSRGQRARTPCVRRAPRRVRRRVVVRRARITRCTDPPEPPHEGTARYHQRDQHLAAVGVAQSLDARWASRGKRAPRRAGGRRITWPA